MLSIQDFRNMVGQYSEGYLSMATDASGNQTLSKVANHHTLTFLNASDAKVQAQLGGEAAQNIRKAFAEALGRESKGILENPAVRRILYGDVPADADKDKAPEFSTKPLSRREVRQVFEVLDLQKLFAKSGVAISKDDLGYAESALFRVKDDSKSAYVKTISLLLPPPVTGKAPRGCLTPALCARIAEKAADLHKAFLGKSEAEISNDLIWKTVLGEAMPANALENEDGEPVSLVQAMSSRLDGMFADAVDNALPEDLKKLQTILAQMSYVGKGLTLAGALKIAKHPEQITRSDITPGCNALGGGVYTRSSTVKQMALDIPRCANLTFGVLSHIGNRPASLQEFKLSGKVSEDQCKTYCDSLESEIQKVYAARRLRSTDTVCTIPPAQVDTILAFCRQEADNLLTYPGVSGVSDKTVLVKANEDGSMDVLVSCRTCSGDHPGSAALCRVYADGSSTILDLALAQEHGRMARTFIAPDL